MKHFGLLQNKANHFNKVRHFGWHFGVRWFRVYLKQKWNTLASKPKWPIPHHKAKHIGFTTSKPKWGAFHFQTKMKHFGYFKPKSNTLATKMEHFGFLQNEVKHFNRAKQKSSTNRNALVCSLCGASRIYQRRYFKPKWDTLASKPNLNTSASQSKVDQGETLWLTPSRRKVKRIGFSFSNQSRPKQNETLWHVISLLGRNCGRGGFVCTKSIILTLFLNSSFYGTIFKPKWNTLTRYITKRPELRVRRFRIRHIINIDLISEFTILRAIF